MKEEDMQMSAAKEPGLASSRMTTTRLLLACGIAAGPIYVLVGVIEAFTRSGFDPTRDDLSVLANGDFGWVHISLLIGTGILTVAGAVGTRRAMGHGRGSTWGPLLIGLYGLGLIGAGLFSADPARGFPPGTPADAHAVSWHGVMHLISGGIGFLGLIAACGVFASRFRTLKENGWAAYSVATGVLFLAAFFGIASGSSQSGTILVVVVLAFSLAVVLGWAWVSAIMTRLLKASVA
jgi:hypothetical protein